MRTFLKVVGH